MTPEPVLASLRAAVESSPEDLVLRMHLAEMLSMSGQRDEAVRHAAEVLRRDPANLGAITLIAGPGHSPGSLPPEPAGDTGAGSQADVLRRLDAELAMSYRRNTQRLRMGPCSTSSAPD